MNRSEKIEQLRRALATRVLVLDGAMGTAIQDLDLDAQAFGGPELEGCNENLNLTRPDLVRKIHDEYFAAGADVTETNTFGGTPLVLAEYGLQDRALEINREAARIAREAADAASTSERPRWVAGSIGPTTKAITVTGGVTYPDLVEHFYIQAKGLYEGGADYFLVETCQDTRNIKAALDAIDRLHAEVEVTLPVAVSGTIEPMGTMLAGQSAEALAASLAHRDLLYLGLNCATGPEFMTDHIRSLSSFTEFPVSCVPNAGLPDEDGNYLETPEMIARVLERFGNEGWLNVVGGCCGTTPAHVAALREIADRFEPRKPEPNDSAFVSGIEFLELTDEMRPILVGERTNVIGSRKFRELIVDGKLQEAAEIGRKQVQNGAQIVDVCLANPDRDEREDMREFLSVLIQQIKAPLMIDSTDEAVIEEALTYSQGKAVINSINLEDGLERFEKVVPIARKYGAALIVGCIDEAGMAVTRERKLEVAKRSYDILTRDFGVRPADIYFDPLVFPCATGDENYTGSAVETIEGVRAIREALPGTKSILGISNVSFGLPGAGREVLNSVFLYHCVQAGLDMAIVNTQKLERYPSIPDHERKLSEDLLWNRGDDPIAVFADHFRDKKPMGPPTQELPLDERLARYIIDGTRDGLVDDLQIKLDEGDRPLDIINGPLMTGMDEVGRLFNNGELIVAEVLQSAESMKAAVAFLEPFMDKADSASRGRVVLATVKGDVHDIGKNLVDIILTNNGFEVINLGIKIPPQQLIEAVREHAPDILGLSGLLVKSAQQMVVTAEDLSQAGVDVPMMVGGAALSRRFVDRRIAPAYGGAVAYATDAMDGLELAKQIVDPEAFNALMEELRKQREAREQTAESKPAKAPVTATRSAHISRVERVPQPPDLQRHVLTNTPLDQIWSYINPVMLYGRHLGLKGSAARIAETAPAAELARTESGRKALELRDAVAEVKALCRDGLMQARGVYQFVRAVSDGNDLLVRSDDGREVRWQLPRQPGPDGLCLADYVEPADGKDDTICVFVVGGGGGIRAAAEDLKQRGEYLKSHILQALALETAEAFAEMLHSRLRSAWGFPDPPTLTMVDRFKAKYQGKRYSFGYPACPRLEDQAPLFDLLRPADIGVSLTDEFMMEPEASVSALVFHHPQATYFDSAKPYRRGGDES